MDRWTSHGNTLISDLSMTTGPQISDTHTFGGMPLVSSGLEWAGLKREMVAFPENSSDGAQYCFPMTTTSAFLNGQTMNHN